MDKIKVSVVIPAYNSEKYIGKAIDSVCSQSLTECVEIVVVIDGGSDDTENAVAEWQTKTPDNRRLVIIKNNGNLGVAESRNIGIEKARGEYIAFLDSDDFWSKDKLEKQLQIFEEAKTDEIKLVFTARELIDENGNGLNKIISAPDRVVYRDLLRGNRINCSSVIMPVDVARSVKMDHPELAEDYIYWLRILKEGGCAVGIDEPLLKYRVLQDSKSGNKIKAAKMHFGSYRVVGIGFLKSIMYFVMYVMNGIKKYR